ncbi:MAG: tetratricopeptide repeat protein [Myxococcota bacterium]
MHSAGGMFCRRILAATAIVAAPVSAARAVEGTPGPSANAVRSDAERRLDRAFQARVAAWVEESLVADEIDAALSRLPEPAPHRSVETLDRLVAREIQRDRGPTTLPRIARPGLVAPGIQGEALRAAQLYAHHQVDEALAILRELDARDDPAGAHILLQVRETRGIGPLPLLTLDFIDAYRRAIRLQREGAMAERARLRIGQLYLSIRFYREAVAALVGLLERDIGEGFRRSARLSLVEAALLDRQPQLALDTLDRIDLSSVGLETHRWVGERRGDALMDLRRYREAEAAYQSSVDDGGRDDATDPRLGLKLALAHLESRWPRRAPIVLERVLEADPEPRQAALAELLFARALRSVGDYRGALEHAHRATTHGDDSTLRALAAGSSIEAGRLGGGEGVSLPPEASTWVSGTPRSPAQGLLTFETLMVEDSSSSGGGVDDELEKLGALFLSLPRGAVRTLVGQELADRARAGLRSLLARAPSGSRGSAAEEGPAVSPRATRETLVRWLGSARLDDDAVLLATEAFWRMGDRASCARWARILRERELRPLERGLATWRGVSCSPVTQPTPAYAGRLLREAEQGDAGAFALALASLAAEIFVERGEPDRAISIYKRSLESIAEPRLAGPIGIRTGMLLGRQRHAALAIPRLRRGIARLDGALAHDPLRSVGVLTLLRLARRVEDRGLVRHILKAEVTRADSWWSSAFRYIGFRAGVLRPPTGSSLFTVAAAELQRAERVRLGLPPAGAPEGASP